MSLFLEKHQMQLAAPPASLDAGATTGDYVCLKDAHSVVFVMWSGVGTAGDDFTVSFFQATDVAGTGAKDLAPPTGSTFVKQAATNHATTGQFSDGSDDIAATNDWTNATNAEQVVLLVVEVQASELDADGGFDCVRMDIDDPGANAQAGGAMYILTMKEQRAVASVPSVIVD